MADQNLGTTAPITGINDQQQASGVDDSLIKEAQQAGGLIGYNYDKTPTVTNTNIDGEATSVISFNTTQSSLGAKTIMKDGQILQTYQGKIVKSLVTPGVDPEVKREPQKSKSTTAMDGSPAMTSWADTAMETWGAKPADHFTEGEQYEKKASGVVANTSLDDYTAAREAKKKQVAEEKEYEDIKNVVSTLRGEVPIDIAELRSLVMFMMEQNGYVVGEALPDDIIAAEAQKEADIQTAKRKLAEYVQACLNLNPVDDNDKTKDLVYSVKSYTEVFLNNLQPGERPHATWANDASGFVSKLIEDNEMVTPHGQPPLYVEADPTSTIPSFVEIMLNYIKNTLESNGYKTPEMKDYKEEEWMNDTLAPIIARIEKNETDIAGINDTLGNIATTLAEINGSLNTINTTISSIQTQTNKISNIETIVNEHTTSINAIRTEIGAQPQGQAATGLYKVMDEKITALKTQINELLSGYGQLT